MGIPFRENASGNNAGAQNPPVLPYPDIIVYDMDGTLLRPSLGNMIIADRESQARKILLAADSAYQAVKELKNVVMPDLHLNKDAKKSLLTLFASLRDDAIETLEHGRDSGITQTLLSNNSRLAVGNKILYNYDIEQYFTHTLFHEDLQGFKKPDPEVMFLLLDALGLQNTQGKTIWMVGDSRNDIKLAMRANEIFPHEIVPIAIGKRSSATSEVMQYPNARSAIIDTLSEMRALLARATPKSDPHIARALGND